MSFEQVEEQLTLDRYNSLQRFWMRHPPTAILLAGYVGYKGPSAKESSQETEDLTELDGESAKALFEVFGVPVKAQR